MGTGTVSLFRRASLTCVSISFHAPSVHATRCGASWRAAADGEEDPFIRLRRRRHWRYRHAILKGWSFSKPPPVRTPSPVVLARSKSCAFAPKSALRQLVASIGGSSRSCIALARIGCRWLGAGTVRAQLDNTGRKAVSNRCGCHPVTNRFSGVSPLASFPITSMPLSPFVRIT
jgi:hypothetical protein